MVTPIDQDLTGRDSRFAILLNLYQREALTIYQVSKLAALSVEEFMFEAGKEGVSVIDYDDDVPDSDIFA